MTAPTAPRPPRLHRLGKWALRLTLAALALAAVYIVFQAADWKWDRVAGQRQLDGATARLDADDPGWRFEDIAAAHNAGVPPEAENTAMKAVRIAEGLPKPAAGKRDPWSLAAELADGRLPNETADAMAWGEIEPQHAAYGPSIAELRTWTAATPRGRIPITSPDGSPEDIRYVHTSKIRDVAGVLAWDALRDAEAGRADRALGTAAAGLHLVRSVEFEPLLIGYLVRTAGASVMVGSAEQTLAWCREPGDPALAAVQALARSEADDGSLGPAMRAERAFVVKSYETSDLARMRVGGGDTPWDKWVFEFQSGRHVPAGMAFALARFDELIPLLDRPPADRYPAAWQYRLPKADDENRFGHTLVRRVLSVVKDGARYRARCLCAAAGLACERYRRTHGRWPDSLADLAAFGVENGPADPFDGRPLRYAKLPDGVVVYSVGEDGKDDGGETAGRSGLRPKDVGFRLWNPDKRNVAKDAE